MCKVKTMWIHSKKIISHASTKGNRSKQRMYLQQYVASLINVYKDSNVFNNRIIQRNRIILRFGVDRSIFGATNATRSDMRRALKPSFKLKAFTWKTCSETFERKRTKYYLSDNKMTTNKLTKKISWGCRKQLNVFEMNEDLFRRIKNTLKLEFYLMNDEWLRDCVEFFVNQNTNVNNNFRFIVDIENLSNCERRKRQALNSN